MTDAARWMRARELFDAVVDLEPLERATTLETACAGDEPLRQEVDSLLAFDRPVDPIARIVAGAALVASTDGPPPSHALPATIGRYRVLEEIGEGGMGRVFLAEDPALGRRVAVKVPSEVFSSDPVTEQRLRLEARAAATLNHPHVCVVHEVADDADGRSFIAMEYLEGETLTARISKGPLPLADVVAIGRQAAGALAHAHAKGVVHRDLKPSNLMLTAHGIKLLDFGLASVVHEATSPGRAPGLTGTVPYMSPEQVRSEPLDARTDLYSFGASLYEAATGALPFDGATTRAMCAAIQHRPLVPPSHRLPGLPEAFDRVIARAMAKDRQDRYQDAGELSAALDALARDLTTDVASPAVARRWPGWLVPALTVAGIVAALAYAWWPAAVALPSPDRDSLLVARVVNATGDAAFDGTLDEALAVMLEQMPFLHLVPETTVRETLGELGRTSEEPLTDDVARAICLRRGVRAWISGAIDTSDSGYTITLAAMDGASGSVIARERVAATGKPQVLAALGQAATALRGALGESRPSLQRFDVPIEAATTASLDALKAFTLGQAQASRGNYQMALGLFEQAVQLDPEFAIAHQAIARQRTNVTFAEPLIAEAATRAFALRNRVTLQERFSIEAYYYSSVEGDLGRAIEILREWAATFPNDWRPFHAVADLYFTTDQFALVIDAERTTLRLNPDMASAYSNLAAALFSLDRFAEARDVYRTAMARGLDAPEYHAFLWRIAYYLGDEEQMRREVAWAATTSSWGANIPALAAALQGRWRESLTLAAQARDGFGRRNMPGLVALSHRYEAITAALVGDCQSARLERALTSVVRQTIGEWERVAVALGLCGMGEKARPLLAERPTARPNDVMLHRLWLPLVRSAIAIERSPRAAIDAWPQGEGVELGADAEGLPPYVRGLAWLRLGRGPEARREFERIIAQRGATRWLPLAPLAQVGAARAMVLDRDMAGARQAYERFFAQWSRADDDLPVMVAARREYEALPASSNR